MFIPNLEGVDDLLWLGDFNQQTLLHNTRERFAHDNIYSFIGMPILIAVNPYKHLPIYSKEEMELYKTYFDKLKRDPNSVAAPKPHLYHIAEAAYQDMITEKKNQSIIISGESGSGKTQSTKIILKFLASSSELVGHVQHISPSNVEKKEEVSVEKQVLDSNPLLEAFGNAKTVRNNNSSRFGKFISVSFTEHGKIISAKIFNYLLEKSRVVHIQPEERNYHIFYQIIKGADESERAKYLIKDLEYYEYLNKGCPEAEDIDDEADFIETKKCMDKLGFKATEMSTVFNVLMGILYLGNVQFIEGVKAGTSIAELDEKCFEDFKKACEFLGITTETLTKVLTIRKMKDPQSNNFFERNLTVNQAYNCRDAIAKAVYAKMFDYIVKRVNAAIANADEMKKHDKDRIRKIGILDIFGFENFQQNSFEQLCINYANERLQQYFNNHIFKLEQEEYKNEGIDFTKVEFQDNKEIIDLIDNGKISLFSILDSEGITPNASDSSFQRKVYYHLQDKSNALGENVEDHICVDHYAGQVYYYVEGFIEKNLDQLTPDIQDALEQSANKLIKKVFEKTKDEGASKKKGAVGASVKAGPNKLQTDSLSKQFKKQLDELLTMLSASNPRYVKCIKPNAVKEPLVLASADVMYQLLSAGVLEAIKIRKQGYSIRRTVEEFVRRYAPITGESVNIKELEKSHDWQAGLEKMFHILGSRNELKHHFDKDKKFIQIGKTKIFMKDEVKHALEAILSRIRYINKIQATERARIVRKRVWKMLYSIRRIQARWRGIEAREFYKMLKICIKLQKNFFRWFIYKMSIFKNLKKLADEGRRIKEEARKKKLAEEEAERKRIREEEEVERKKQLELERLKELERMKESGENMPSESLMNNPTYGSETAGNSFDVVGDTNEKTVEKAGGSKKRTNPRLPNVRESLVSHKESIGDVSNTDMLLLNDLKGLGREKKQHNKKVKTNFMDLLQTAEIENALKDEIEKVQADLNNTRAEKEKIAEEANKFKEELRKREKEIELLKSNESSSLKAQLDNLNANYHKYNTEFESNFMEKAKKGLSNFDPNSEVNQELQDEIKKLKREVSEKEGNIDILNLKIDELTKSNKDLQLLNESLKGQMLKRKDIYDKQLDEAYLQINKLELKKSEYESVNKSLIEEKMYDAGESHKSSFLGKTSSKEDSSENKKLLQDLKSENKLLNKKLEEIKSKCEKDIQLMKNEIYQKETKLTDTEKKLKQNEEQMADTNEKYENMKLEYDLCKEKIQDMRVKLENLTKNSKLPEYEKEINKMKAEFDNNVKKKDVELKDLKESLDKNKSLVERLRNMENALKMELDAKDSEMRSRQQTITELQEENDKLSDDNTGLKKDNYQLMSKVECLEKEYRDKSKTEKMVKMNELKQLREKERRYAKMITEMKDTLKKKQRVIDNKKNMNLMLIDLAKIKKGEVQCLETMQYTSSDKLKETLAKVRENERELLSK